MKTWKVSLLGEETIQGRKLCEEIRYVHFSVNRFIVVLAILLSSFNFYQVRKSVNEKKILIWENSSFKTVLCKTTLSAYKICGKTNYWLIEEENILKGKLDLIQSPSPSMKI